VAVNLTVGADNYLHFSLDLMGMAIYLHESTKKFKLGRKKT